MKSIRVNILITAALLVSAALLFFFRPDYMCAVDSGFIEVMGTFGHIIVVADSENKAQLAIDSAFREIKRLDEIMSDYLNDSELSQLNSNAYNQPVQVSDELFDVLERSIYYSRLSNGAFDITIGPVVDLWRNAELQNKKPSQQEIQQARSRVGFEKILLDRDNRTASFSVDGMRLDLGAIAKGYAIDRAVDLIRNSQCEGALVDIGGDMRCFGRAPGKKKNWIVGLQDPQNDSDILLKLRLDNAAIATSGDYRRFVEIDGIKMSHIMNPATLDSARNMTSVTVFAPKAIDADSLATTVSVLGLKKGIELIEKIQDTEAIVLSNSQTMTKTSNAHLYILE